jgi:hypothetical protein
LLIITQPCVPPPPSPCDPQTTHHVESAPNADTHHDSEPDSDADIEVTSVEEAASTGAAATCSGPAGLASGPRQGLDFVSKATLRQALAVHWTSLVSGSPATRPAPSREGLEASTEPRHHTATSTRLPSVNLNWQAAAVAPTCPQATTEEQAAESLFQQLFRGSPEP